MKGTFRNTKNENKRHKIFNMVLHMNWDYVSGKKKKKKKEKKNKQKGKKKQLKKNPLFFLYDSWVPHLKKNQWLNP